MEKLMFKKREEVKEVSLETLHLQTTKEKKNIKAKPEKDV